MWMRNWLQLPLNHFQWLWSFHLEKSQCHNRGLFCRHQRVATGLAQSGFALQWKYHLLARHRMHWSPICIEPKMDSLVLWCVRNSNVNYGIEILTIDSFDSKNELLSMNSHKWLSLKAIPGSSREKSPMFNSHILLTTKPWMVLSGVSARYDFPFNSPMKRDCMFSLDNARATFALLP